MKIAFAPMEGLTGALYRQAHCRWFGGVDRYFIPFITPTQDHRFTKRELREILPEHNRGLAAVLQLLVRRAEDFLWAAGELAAMGYPEINLNLGCPSGTVVAKGKGSGFLGLPEELERFLDTVFDAAPCAASIKTRPGPFPARLHQARAGPAGAGGVRPPAGAVPALSPGGADRPSPGAEGHV